MRISLSCTFTGEDAYKEDTPSSLKMVPGLINRYSDAEIHQGRSGSHSSDYRSDKDREEKLR